MFKYILLGILLNGLSLYVVSELVDSFDLTGGLSAVILGGFILGILNTFVKPLMKLFTFPLILLTGGLFTIVINVGILYLTEELFNTFSFEGISMVISGTSAYIKGAIILGIVNWLVQSLIKN